jgi:hypothetical protein
VPLTAFDEISDIDPWVDYKQRQKFTPGLLRANKTIHREASSPFYAQNRFDFTMGTPEDVASFLRQIMALERPLVYLIRMTLVMIFTFQDQPATGRDWTDDWFLLRGVIGVRPMKTPKAVFVGRCLTEMDSVHMAPKRVDSCISPVAVDFWKAVFKETKRALVRGRPWRSGRRGWGPR